MIIKKGQDPALLRTPRERKSEVYRGRETQRNGLDERNTFEDLIQNPMSKTHEKAQQQKQSVRSTRTFTLGSLEKRDRVQNRSSSKFDTQARTDRPKLPKYCSRHNTKQATHVVFNDHNQATVYCEKCSIGLASRGWMLSRLDPITERNPRASDQLDRFMNNLNLVLNELLQRKEDTSGNIKRCQTEFGRQIEEINEYFSVLQLTLEMEKNRQYTSILSLRRDAENEQRRLCSIYEKCIDELNKILDNIVVMRQNITNDYEQIVEEFSPRLQRYSQIVRSGPSKFTIKPLRLNNVEEVQERFHELITPNQVKITKSIITKLHDPQSRIKTVVTEYDKSLDLQLEQQEESNLITQQEDSHKTHWRPTNSDLLIQLIQ